MRDGCGLQSRHKLSRLTDIEDCALSDTEFYLAKQVIPRDITTKRIFLMRSSFLIWWKYVNKTTTSLYNVLCS